jgi:hypothetical protein
MRVESDDWGPGPNILADDTLALLRAALAETPLIVEHWFYRGGSSPRRYVFEEFEELEKHVRDLARPGDAFWIWRFDKLCLDDNALAVGKRPDADGAVPARGAY